MTRIHQAPTTYEPHIQASLYLGWGDTLRVHKQTAELAEIHPSLWIHYLIVIADDMLRLVREAIESGGLHVGSDWPDEVVWEIIEVKV